MTGLERAHAAAAPPALAECMHCKQRGLLWGGLKNTSSCLQARQLPFGGLKAQATGPAVKHSETL